METKSIVIKNKGLTSDECDLEMLKQIEKLMNTGPIIGEARMVLLQMLRNIGCMSMVLDALGLGPEKMKSVFIKTNDLTREVDAKIISQRVLDQSKGVPCPCKNKQGHPFHYDQCDHYRSYRRVH